MGEEHEGYEDAMQYVGELKVSVEQQRERAEQAEALADDLENQCNELKAGLEQAEGRVAELEVENLSIKALNAGLSKAEDVWAKGFVEKQAERDRYRADCAAKDAALQMAVAQLEADHNSEVAAEMFGGELDPARAIAINRHDVAEACREALSDRPGGKLLANYEMVKNKLRVMWRDDCLAAKTAKEAFFKALED